MCKPYTFRTYIWVFNHWWCHTTTVIQNDAQYQQHKQHRISNNDDHCSKFELWQWLWQCWLFHDGTTSTVVHHVNVFSSAQRLNEENPPVGLCIGRPTACVSLLCSWTLSEMFFGGLDLLHKCGRSDIWLASKFFENDLKKKERLTVQTESFLFFRFWNNVSPTPF